MEHDPDAPDFEAAEQEPGEVLDDDELAGLDDDDVLEPEQVEGETPA